MKTRKTVLVIALSVGVLLFLGTCVTTETPLPTDNIDELVGTWVNTDYTVRPQKIIIGSDGVYVTYKNIEYTVHSGTGTLRLIEKWKDSKGNIFCKIRSDEGGYPVYELEKISNSGTVLEYVVDYQDYPNEVNQNDLEYRIYYRQ
jgi:hypothetical protein